MKAHQSTGPERHLTLLNGAARVSRSIASILDLNILLNRTVDIICDEFGFYYAGVFLVDEHSEWAVLTAGRGAPGRVMLTEGHKLQIGGNSMVGAALASRSGRIALDVGAEAVFFKNPHLPDTRSEMALPLIAGEEVIGALTVQSEVEAAFKDEDIAALQTMADQLAVAIANARLVQFNQTLLRQADRRARLLRAANTVGQEVTSILELDTLLPRMVETIVSAYGFYYAGVFLTDESGEWAHLRSGYGEAGKAMVAEGHKLQVGGNSMVGTCIRLSEARIALDVGEEPVHFKNPHLPDTRSEMDLPLRFDRKVLGAVTIQSREEQAFSEDDITTLQTMADHLAVAINNAYTLEELKATHAELLRTKVYEALTVATTEAIHWIGNKAMPITMTIARLQEDLAESNPDLESLKEDLALISESAAQIVQVKEQLIGQVREQEPRPILLADVIQTAARQRGVEDIRIEIAEEVEYVIADSTQLTRALGNLLQNAREAGAGQVEISAKVGPEKGTVHILLADDGQGMPVEVRDKAWSPFFSTRPGHHGLGLPAARHIVTQLGGQITFTSQPGKGTSVKIILPSGYPLLGDLGEAPTILLFDDDDEWSRFLLKMVGTAKLATKMDPKAELILVDEYADNFEAIIAEIQAAKLAERTVVVTAAVDVDRMTALLRAGIRDVRLKPYSPAELPGLWQK
ncbi:MAG: GAF domain-containing protein [Anaerolineales bacterium]|nr:GAF domain-containing protein [Anaerolineales bacterium]